MTNLIRQIRSQGVPALLTAALLVVVILGVKSYIDILIDRQEAHKLVERDLTIVEHQIMSTLRETEYAAYDLGEEAEHLLASPQLLYRAPHRVLEVPAVGLALP